MFTLSLCRKLFSQNKMLDTISAISLGGYLLNGNVFVIAFTHSFTVMMYHSISGTCLFLDAMFRAIHISDSPFLIHSKAPSANILHIQNPLALYVQGTCAIDVIRVLLSCCIWTQQPRNVSLDVIIIKGILFTAIRSTARVTSPYFSIILCGTIVHDVHTCSVGHIVIFHFKDPRLGPKTSS